MIIIFMSCYLIPSDVKMSKIKEVEKRVNTIVSHTDSRQQTIIIDVVVVLREKINMCGRIFHA